MDDNNPTAYAGDTKAKTMLVNILKNIKKCLEKICLRH